MYLHRSPWNINTGEYPAKNFFFFFFFFLAALGLSCCAQAFSSCSERGQGLLFIAVSGLVIAVASLVAEEHKL